MKRHDLPDADREHILRYADQAWPALQGARIFITGGTGFIGKWLVEGLLHANRALGLNAEMTLLSRDVNRFLSHMPHLAEEKAVTLVQGDVRDFTLPKGTFSHAIHAATDVAASAAAYETYDVIARVTKRVLDFCKERGARDVLFVSSGAVYGRQPSELSHIPESYTGAPDLTRPETAYGQGKRIAEWLCSLYQAEGSLNCRIARCFAFIGAWLPLDGPFAAGNFINDILRGKPIEIQGDGTACRSYLYAADMTAWLLTLLAKGEPGPAYNVGAEEAISIGDLAHKIAALTQPAREVIIRKTPREGVPAERYVPATTLARTLGLEARIPLDDGLRRMLDWARSEGV